MKKSAVTFAEIFIVLGLIFIIQTVANFNVYDGKASSDPAAFVVLTLRQIPSGESQADHIDYIRVRSPERDWVFHANPAGLLPYKARYRVGVNGNCSDFEPPKIGSTFTHDDFSSFAEQLLIDFGVSVQRVEVAGVQPEYVFSWQPTKLKENVRLSVAMHHCMLPVVKNNLKLEPKWKLPYVSFEWPHPLILSITEFRDAISVMPPRVSYTHAMQLSPNPLRSMGDGDSRNSGFLFYVDGKFCSLDAVIRTRIRDHINREIEISLSDL